MTARVQFQSPQISMSAGAAVLWLAAGWGLASMTVMTLLESADVAATFLSRSGWLTIVDWLGGSLDVSGQTLTLAEVPFWPIGMLVGVAMVLGWLGTGLGARIGSRRAESKTLCCAGTITGRWACVVGLWSVLWLLASNFDGEQIAAFLERVVGLWIAVSLAGWMTESVGLCQPKIPVSDPADSAPVPKASHRVSRRSAWWVLAAIGIYTAVYTTMNWQMYWALLVPHGDSAMYEEHLWNLLHGKGFRSYLDQGLFLGEHIQVIHLALIPLYVLWPSHLLLELCESLALAATALPVFWIARRHTQSSRVALWMSLATLLYFPLHYLDIAIDFKTFRPISFGVPLLMFAIDQMERRRYGTMALLLAATLTAKEDYAIVIAPFGLWLCWAAWRARPTSEPGALATGPSATTIGGPVAHAPCSDGRAKWAIAVGAATALLSAVYLFLAVKVLIPWFRGGETVHYARYFSRFGETPSEIALNMVTRPGLLWGELVTVGTIIYGLRVIVPLGGAPLLSPTRLLVGAPLFVLLCLNELAQSTPAPVHHFHAPLVPIVLWSAAAGLPSLLSVFRGKVAMLTAARFACFCALLTGAVVSFHPLSIPFWDAGRSTYWRRLFVPGERARQFAKIEEMIPRDARVASTDFVHPRFTHYGRSYDYSNYRRKVAGYQHRVPEDTDYIVIDTQHRYSTIKRPEDVRELREHPERWELLPDTTDGYFIVVKRRSQPSEDR